MKKDINRAFLIVFVVLALATSFPVWKGYLSFDEKSSIPSELDFSTLEKDKIDKIVIKNANEEKILVKEGDNWRIGETEASPAKLDRFFGALVGLEIGELVSKNPENHPSYGLGDGEGIGLSVFNGDKVAAFVVGRAGPAVDSFYIKKKDSEKAYVAHSDLRSQLLQSISVWQDKPDEVDEADAADEADL